MLGISDHSKTIELHISYNLLKTTSEHLIKIEWIITPYTIFHLIFIPKISPYSIARKQLHD